MLEESTPAWTLVRAAHSTERHFAQLFLEVGLTPPQFGVLSYLHDDGSRTQAELARLVLVRPQTIAALVGTLVERGLVVRVGPGGRGRRSGITLTAAGRAVLDRARPRLRAFNAPASLGLTAAQAALLDELLAQVQVTLDARSSYHLDRRDADRRDVE